MRARPDWDVAIDLRPESKTYCRWASVELSPQARQLYYIPRGCAHGFMTLEDLIAMWPTLWEGQALSN